MSATAVTMRRCPEVAKRKEHVLRSGRIGSEGSLRFPEPKQSQAKKLLLDLLNEYGHTINSYPIWHPLSTENMTGTGGFRDHRICFRDAVLYGPYHDHWGDFSQYAKNMKLEAKNLKGVYHHENCSTYLLLAPINIRGTSSQYLYRPAVIDHFLKNLDPEKMNPYNHNRIGAWASWEEIHPLILGTPCGRRSSLFVDESTGQALRRLYSVIGQAYGFSAYGRL